jgi:hypothetical protein
MGWEQFTSNLVGDLVWPAVVVVAITMFRHPLARAIRSLQSVKWRDFEATFERQVEETQQVAEALRPEVTAKPYDATVTAKAYDATVEAMPAWVARLRVVATTSPSAAVLDAWREVEGEIRRIARRYGRASAVKAAQMLAEAGVIPRNVLGVILDLAGLRNQVAHTPDAAVSEDAALSYISAAESVVEVLRAIQPQ